MTAEASVLLTGDLVIDEPDPDRYFELARPVLDSADLVVGHVEVPFTLRDNPTPGRDPAKLAALRRAGIRVATLAANHLYDQGQAGLEDTGIRECTGDRDLLAADVDFRVVGGRGHAAERARHELVVDHVEQIDGAADRGDRHALIRPGGRAGVQDERAGINGKGQAVDGERSGGVARR